MNMQKQDRGENVNNFNRARQLKFVREYRGFSQTQLCKNIRGLSQSNLSSFERVGVGIK